VLVGFDIDGCIDADPSAWLSLALALKAAGHGVAILTGSSEATDLPEYQAKAEYLQSMGWKSGVAYDELVIFQNPTSKAKAKWCRKHHVEILFDNDIGNAEAAMRYCVVAVPWATKEK
jgi:hypothetical protein